MNKFGNDTAIGGFMLHPTHLERDRKNGKLS